MSGILTSAPLARTVMQQCISARLMVKPEVDESPAEYVNISRGVVVFICFLKGATSEIVQKAAKSVLDVRLSYCLERKKNVSILDLPGDVLIIPQFTLGGKAKGKMMQYHNNISKDEGRQLFSEFVETVKIFIKKLEMFPKLFVTLSVCRSLESTIEEKKQHLPNNCVVQHGTYGNLQVLNMETNGPYTHIIDF